MNYSDPEMAFGNGSIADKHPLCQGPTDQQMAFFHVFAWWVEGFGQILVGCLGFIANSVAIPILLSKEMCNMFNRLLTCLAICDNIFILCSVLEAVRKHVGSTELHLYIYGTFLYQFHNMILCCSTYMTVVLALERYKAVWRPVEYRNAVVASVHPWCRILLSYILPVAFLSVTFNIPKFFETSFYTAVRQVSVLDEATDRLVLVNRTELKLTISELKMNTSYVLWYSNVSRLLVTGAIPLGAMAYFNSRIYCLLKRRRRMNHRPNQALAQQKAEENRQAIVLFAIVILFVICHAMRIILNIQDVVNLDRVKASVENSCNGIPFWVLMGVCISHFLITVNASVNFFIYCLMSKPFRQILKRKVSRLLARSPPWHRTMVPAAPQTDSSQHRRPTNSILEADIECYEMAEVEETVDVPGDHASGEADGPASSSAGAGDGFSSPTTPLVSAANVEKTTQTNSDDVIITSKCLETNI